MASSVSPRLRAVVAALPLRPGMRVLEVGGAPGAAARLVAQRVGPGGHVLVVDRSARGVELTRAACADEIVAGAMSVLCTAVEDLELPPGTAPFDLALACRVGVLDGRHPRGRDRALATLAEALVPGARLYLDTGDPLDEVVLGG
ncbi:methyltransferase domain-containing protein [Janibacter sp. UYMM211]|uniref:SAM-dependent methyltransferase n=1 Tax=Janibacter sp. UYMM211 TaxID=3156342 RepID=UPI00339826DB